MRIRSLILALLGTIGAARLLDAQYIRIGNAEAIPNWLALGTSMGRKSKVGRRIKSILKGRVGLARSMRGFSWAVMLAVAVPAVYGASAFQLTSVLKTPPSPYASMSWIRRYRVEVPRPKVSALYPRRVPTRHPQPLAVFNRCFLLLLHVFERPRDGGLQPFLPVM